MLLMTNAITRTTLTVLHIIGTFCFILKTSMNPDLLLYCIQLYVIKYLQKDKNSHSSANCRGS